MMLSIFSCAYQLSVYLLRRDVYLDLLPIFWLGFLILNCMSCLYILEIKPLLVLSFENIFSQFIGCVFSLFMVSFAVQKLLSLIRAHLFIFPLFSITLGDETDPKNIAAIYVLPVFLLEFYSTSIHSWYKQLLSTNHAPGIGDTKINSHNSAVAIERNTNGSPVPLGTILRGTQIKITLHSIWNIHMVASPSSVKSLAWGAALFL